MAKGNLRKTTEKNLRQWQKPNFGPDFGPFWPKSDSKKIFVWVLTILDATHCISLYAISRKTTKANLRKWQKT